MTPWQDSLGQTALTEIDHLVITTGNDYVPTSQAFTYSDASGTTQSTFISSTSLPVATAFTCTSGGMSLDVSPKSMYLPNTITMPGGGQYTISYESTPGYPGYVTGRPAKITLPSGGYVAFSYGNGAFGGTDSIAGYNCVAGTIPWLQVSVNDGNGHTSTTTYQNDAHSVYVVGAGSAWVSGPGNYTVTESDSLGDVTTHSFFNEIEEKRVVSDVNKGVLQTTITCYNGNFTNCDTAGYPDTIQLITQKDVYTYVGSAAPSLVETKYDAYGNLTQTSRYDIGAAFPPSIPPISTTTSTYDINGACGTFSVPYIYDRPCSITTTNSSGTTVSQTNYTYNSTGHAVQTTGWISGSIYATTSAQYNSNGTVANVTDANNHTTTYTYGDCNGMLPTATTYPTANGVTQSTSEQWNCDGAVIANSMDANGKTTTYSYADPLWRSTGTSFPDGGSTTTTYSNGSILPWTVSTSTAINSGSDLTQTRVYDGLSRVTQTQTTSDSMGTDYIDTSYDLLGRVYSVSNPHRSAYNSTDGITRYTYDALNRPTLITEPGNGSAQISTSYVNNCATTTDENGNARESCVDGLGRLSGVWEDPGSSPHLNYETDYLYSASNNLTSVTQKGGVSSGWRTRFFAYDGLSRLTNASNPESGAVSYKYDANGNLLYKTDARGVITAYSYDALNRLTSRKYSGLIASVPGTDPSSFVYDVGPGPVVPNSVGRLVSEYTGPAGAPTTQRTILAYDAMGRITQESQCITAVGCGAVPYKFQYMYDLAGNVTYSNNGVTAMGIGFSSTYDGAGRLKSVVSTWGDWSHPATLFAPPVSGAQYGPAGLIGASLGIMYTGGPPLYSQQRSYDNRLRIISELDTNPLSTTPAAPSSGSITINGSEGPPSAGASYSATASANILGGTDQSEPLPSPPGNCLVVGSECYDAGGGTLAVITLRASNGQTVGTTNYSYSYGANDTNSSIAGALVKEINASSSTTGFSATQTGGTISLALDATSSFPVIYILTGGGGCSNIFRSCSFQYVPGAVGPVTAVSGPPSYDAGSMTVGINGIKATATWGAGSSAQTIASQLSSALQGSGFLNAVPSGSSITLKSISTGTSTNWPVTCTAIDSVGQTPSFSAQCSGMGGGTNQVTLPLTLYSYSIPAGGYAANGNLLAVNDSAIGNWAYTYDTLNRLQTAQASANPQTGYAPYGGAKLTWAYDSFGNYKSETLSGNTQFPMPQPLPYSYTGTNTNRIDNFNYDASGNQLSDPVSGLNNYYVYDAEARLYSTGNGAVQYLYDAEGRRVAKLQGTKLKNQYLLGLGGEQVSELDGQGNWLHTNAYAGGRLLATYSKDSLHFQFTDWLGSRRVQASGQGVVEETCLNLPYGDMLQCSVPGSDATEHHFTGKERDTESGLDYFGARYYGSTMGRFMSPDPSVLDYADFTNPQSLNLYSYVLNNPLKFTDADGLACQWDDGTQDDAPGDGGASFGDCNAQGGSWVENTTVNVTADSNGNQLDVTQSDTSGTFIDFLPGPGCSAALKTAGANKQALNRYYGLYQGTIQGAADANGVDPSLLGSVGIRETGLRNIAQSGGGMGRGVFQVDLGAHPNVSSAQAFDPSFSANFAASMLGNATQGLQGQGYSSDMSTAGAVRQYNAGQRYLAKKMKQGVAGLDRGTTGGNYVSNVLALQSNCF